MAEWVDFDRWPDCPEMATPGIVFEVGNDAGQSLVTPCVVPLEWPAGWAPPVRFRAVVAPAPSHSGPIPKPIGKNPAGR